MEFSPLFGDASKIPVAPDQGLSGSSDGRAPEDRGHSRDCPDPGSNPTEPERDRTSSVRLAADRPGFCGQNDHEPVLDPGVDRASSGRYNLAPDSGAGALCRMSRPFTGFSGFLPGQRFPRVSRIDPFVKDSGLARGPG